MTGAHGETANQAQATISETGEIINHRRKIKPTHYEKTIFGDGSGTFSHAHARARSHRHRSHAHALPLTLSPVDPQRRADAVRAPRLAQLLGADPGSSPSPSLRRAAHSLLTVLRPHAPPALKLHFYSQLPQIFVGGWWPAFPAHTGGAPYIVSGEASARMTQAVSMEGGCFGLTACHVVSEEGAKIMMMDKYPWFKVRGARACRARVFFSCSCEFAAPRSSQEAGSRR